MIEIKVKPHGNSKSVTPFIRTSESAQQRIQEVAMKEKPKSAVFTLTKEAGGEVEVATPSVLPRNRQQISNIRRSHNVHDKNVLYSVMLECKLTQGSNEAFVRDVKAAPSPNMSCILTGSLVRWNAFSLITVNLECLLWTQPFVSVNFMSH